MTVWIIAALAIFLSIIIEGILLLYLLPMFKENKVVRKNYLGEEIPIAIGITFPMAILTTYILYQFLNVLELNHILFLLGILGISFLGFIDDMIGQRDTLGFRGHFGALFKGKMTTGGLKALGGGAISFFISILITSNLLEILINTLLIALATNMMNLFDLRPGRAIKVFFTLIIAIILATKMKIDYLLIAPLLGAVLYYFIKDMKAKVMMGDAGSNVLGFALGFIAVISLTLSGKLIALFLLIIIHILTEKYSISETIEKIPLLRKLDQMGRG